jgi:glycine/D-amino acid oxidase-like deaminating enzyme
MKVKGLPVFDVIVIGAGVIGAAIARVLSKYNLQAAILEKEFTGSTRDVGRQFRHYSWWI